MQIALSAALITSLLLAAVARAARPGGLLAFLGGWWLWWAIHKPLWLPDKPTGACVLCTTFYVPGIPAALAVALLTPAGWWALAIPPMIAALSEKLIYDR